MVRGLPKNARRRVKEAFVSALRTDPTLKSVVKYWLTWDGDTGTDVAPPTVFPAIQVRMMGGPVARKAQASGPGQPRKFFNESTFTVLVEAFTAGTDSGDLCDLADAICEALEPQDDDRRAALAERFRNAGIASWQLTREILPASGDSFALEAVGGAGTYALTVFTAA